MPCEFITQLSKLRKSAAEAVDSVCFQARKCRNYRTICLKHGIIDAGKRAGDREKPCIRRPRCTSEN